jgi:hypothetical protein
MRVGKEAFHRSKKQQQTPSRPDKLLGVCYYAQAEGIFASYLNHPIEVPELRPRLRDAIGSDGLP